MTDVTAERRLVKSPPELWTELSEVETLAKHLGELGEIRITKVEPESTVAWEGETISGTVELEQSGWGTKVTLSATVPEPDRAAPPERTAPPDRAAPPERAAPPDRVAPPEQIAPPVEPDPGPIVPPQEDPEPEPGPLLPPEEEPDPQPIRIPEPEPQEPAPAAAGAGDGDGHPERPGLWARLLRRRPKAAAPERAALASAAEEQGEASAETAVEPAAESEPVATEAAAVAAAEPIAVPAPEPEPEPAAVVAAEPVAVAAPEPDLEPAAPALAEAGSRGLGPERVREILDGTLDALGQAHHRPFSRG